MPFQPKRGMPPEPRLKHVEDFLARLGDPQTAAAPAVAASSDFSGDLPEVHVLFDPDDGHQHDGVDSHTVDHDNLANVTADQHHPQLHEADHQSGGGDALTGLLDANARLAVAKAGTVIGTRRKINLIEGSNVTLTVADNSGAERVDVTIAASGGGGGGGWFQCGEWIRSDVSSAFSTPHQMNMAGGTSGIKSGIVIANPAGASLQGVSISLDGSVGGSGDGYVVEVYINGVATGVHATVNILAGSNTQAFGVPTTPVAVAQGDLLSIWDNTAGSPSAGVGAVAVAWLT